MSLWISPRRATSLSCIAAVEACAASSRDPRLPRGHRSRGFRDLRDYSGATDLRRSAERIAAGAMLAGLGALRWTRLRRGIVLVYHRVEEQPGDPKRELVPALSIDTFMWQLAALRRHFNPVRAAELPSAASGRRWGTRLPVALTLDD